MPIKHGQVLFWTPERRWILESMLAEGQDDETIARRLGTTAYGVKAARMRFGIAARLRQGYTRDAAARLLGVPPSSLRRWHQYGWLRMRHGPNRVRGVLAWMVSASDLYAFLDNPDYWHAWQPQMLTDDALRRYYTRLRGHVVYLSASEAAHEIGITTVSVLMAARAGRLAHRRDGKYYRFLAEDVRRYAESHRDRQVESLRRGAADRAAGLAGGRTGA